MQDRFMVCLVLAIGLHAALVLGIKFGTNLNAVPRLADTLDIVLVRWRSETAPEEADFLAQANQQGGGESTEKTRPAQPVSGQFPKPEQGQNAVQSTQQVPAHVLPLREVITVESVQGQPLETTELEQPEVESPNAAG
jgi:protein TonB